MSFDITKYRTPQEALLALAAYAVELEARIESLETAEPVKDTWQDWGEPTVAEPEGEDWLNPGERAEIEGQIAEKKAELANNEDAQESMVLRATISLLEDKLIRPPEKIDLDQQRTVQVRNTDGSVVVDVPEVSEEVEAERYEFAIKQLKLHEQYGEEAGKEYARSYAKGGPLVLYYTDRDFVLGLTDDLKAAMVQDVEQHSPAEAHEMARDLLKDFDAEEMAAATLQIAEDNAPEGETG